MPITLAEIEVVPVCFGVRNLPRVWCVSISGIATRKGLPAELRGYWRDVANAEAAVDRYLETQE